MWLRRFSKLTCFSTVFLIFVGGMVTSTGSGLAVPDWPLSYGTLFPPMVGGIFYEHGHRVVASFVGFLMLILAIWLGIAEKRRWVRYLGFAALGAVVLQGILGGLTVLFLLPTPISVTHAVLAQTFFVLTIIIAYSQSEERKGRQLALAKDYDSRFRTLSVLTPIVIYVQLILGAIMRHTHSGLAIPDFPTMGGTYWPTFDQRMFSQINEIRFNMDLGPVTSSQVVIHFLHRMGALLVLCTVGLLVFETIKKLSREQKIMELVFAIGVMTFFQVLLGALTVLTGKLAYVASLHVVCGAILLGMSVLLALRVMPLRLNEYRVV